ncbi:DUF5906 domain-containing protein [Methylobacterium sp. J-070]|uniref:DNA primase family protein n=1 Tax=Methylobacterium sp. J-070 TaxID=2836650 RepID=UPI001FB95449|nr:DNA primase family protein [Methylobacterium sp. J-070]MCJ2052934.1 hypothetical protein [Methylobacterium sp. J-070]
MTKYPISEPFIKRADPKRLVVDTPRLLVSSSHQAALNSIVDLTQIVLDAEFAGGAHLTFTDGAFEWFGGTHWVRLSEEQLGRIVLPYILRGGSTRQRVPAQIRELITILRHASASPVRDRETESPPIINMANCELWFDATGKTTPQPHDPRSDLRYCLPIAYDPDARCPRYDRALAEIFSASTDPAALIALWHEITGYLIQPLRRRALIIVALGRGQDGKSALAETLVRVLGSSRVMAMPVGDLTGSRFVVASLADKALFLDPDMAAGTTLPDGLLKQMAEATTMTGDRKFREPITFRSSAVPLIVTNHVPRLVDGERGFRRRLIVLPFERHFGDGEVNNNLFPEIYANEMPGVLNRMLEGLHRVITRGWQFDLPCPVTRLTEAWWQAARSTTNSHASTRTVDQLLKGISKSDELFLQPDATIVESQYVDNKISKSKSVQNSMLINLQTCHNTSRLNIEIKSDRSIEICLNK